MEPAALRRWEIDTLYKWVRLSEPTHIYRKGCKCPDCLATYRRAMAWLRAFKNAS